MADFVLDHRLLRELEHGDLAQYLRSRQNESSEEHITAEIASTVRTGSVPPETYRLWLSIAKTAGPIASAIEQSFSVLVRSHAIKEFGKKMKSPSWESVWNALGKAEGILSLFGRLSVVDVKSFCKVLGRCGNATKIAKREESIEQLLRGLLRSMFPESILKSRDERPLDRYYIKMSPACSADFVRQLLEKAVYIKNWEFPVDQLTSSLSPLFREYAVQAIFENKRSRLDVWEYLPALVKRHPPLKADFGFSASMSFSAEIIQRIVAQGRMSYPPSSFLRLAEPLIERAVRRKANYDRIAEIVALVLTYMESHNECHRDLASGNSRFQHALTKLWSRRPDLFEKSLISVLKFSRDVRNLSAYEQLASRIWKNKRYDLLQLYCLHVPRLIADIGNGTQLAALPKGIWEYDHFSSLPGERGLRLLERLINIQPEGDFLNRSYGQGLCSYPASRGIGHPDPKLLLAQLKRLSRGPAGEEEATKLVDHHKTLSIRSRDQEDRSFHAKAALFHAIANGSLETYHKTLVWAQRFTRDPLTIKSLYSYGTTREAVSLLALPTPIDDSLTVAVVQDYVSKANKILLTFLETACLALREPSFQAYDWRGSLSLFRSVVDARADGLGDLSKSASLSDSEMYDAVWPDTIQVLLEAENTGHRPGYEGIQFNQPGGPLGFHVSSSQNYRVHHSSFYRFLDTLAKERDLLWQKFRRIMNSEVTVLPLPWPRGLPLQNLVIDYDVTYPITYEKTPYINSRSASVVSISRDLAGKPAPGDSTIKDAIGSFVDSFTLALKIQVMQQPSDAARSKRLSQLWSYAFDSLTLGRMSNSEALRFWRPIFEQAVPHLAHELPPNEKDPEYPLLPEGADPQEITDWDTNLDQPAPKATQELQPTILDCLLNASSWSSYSSRGFSVPRPSTIGTHPSAIWSFRASKRIQEGIIVSAVLYLDSKRSAESGTRLLSSPFPSIGDMRYPPLMLDSAFLLKSNLHEADALNGLSSVLSRCPPTLLSHLARSLAKELSQMQPNNPRISSLEQTTYGLLRLLSASDCPWLASNIVVRTILDRPDASSWHRQLLTKSFLRRLEPSQAKANFISFANGIQEKLESSKKRTQEGPEDPKAAKPFVKVTTVKFLAQTLDDADFVSVKDAIEVLTKILRTASHIDIRVAVIDTMLAMIMRNEKDSNELIEHVFNAFEPMIPVLGGFDERYPINADGWLEAENSCEPPYVSEEIESLPPLLEAFIQSTGKHHLPQKLRHDITTRILLPSLKTSVDNNTRWLRLFVAKCGHTLEGLNLPPVPVKVRFLPRLINHTTSVYLPASVLSLYHDYILTLIEPSAGLRGLLDQIKTDPILRTSNSGKHFLSLFDERPQSLYNITNLLSNQFSPTEVRNGITISQVQGYAVQQCKSLLRVSGPSFQTWQHFVRKLEPPFHFGRSATDAGLHEWRQNTKPVLEKVIADVESYRHSPAWQSNPKRSPTVLPRTFHLELWLLPYTVVDATKPGETLYEVYAARIIWHLEQLVQRGLAAHLDDYGDISAAAMRLQSWDWKVNVGCILGDLGSRDFSAVQHLRVKIAEKLLEGVRRKAVRSDDWAKLRGLFKKWKECSVEEVRFRGWILEEQAGRD